MSIHLQSHLIGSRTVSRRIALSFLPPSNFDRVVVAEITHAYAVCVFAHLQDFDVAAFCVDDNIEGKEADEISRVAYSLFFGRIEKFRSLVMPR